MHTRYEGYQEYRYMAKGCCLNCGKVLHLGKKPRKGQYILCYACGADLRVAQLSPIELDWTLNDGDRVKASESDYSFSRRFRDH